MQTKQLDKHPSIVIMALTVLENLYEIQKKTIKYFAVSK
jgi:hypothetical protein